MYSTEHRLSPAAVAAVISTVLNDDDMLGEILLRLAFPTNLVRAALVCRRWLRVASDSVFLRRSRDLHLPRLIGFYIEHARAGAPWLPRRPKFVAMPSLTAELAALARRASTVLDAHTDKDGWVIIKCCRNGRLFVTLVGRRRRYTDVVLYPLHPLREASILSPPRYNSGEYLPNGGRGGEDICVTAVASSGWQPRRTDVDVYAFRGGAWCNLASLRLLLPRPPRAFHLSLIDGNKPYVVASEGTIAALRLPSSSVPSNVSGIALPYGLENSHDGSYKMTRAPDHSGFYLAYGKDFQIHVLLHRIGSDYNGDNWSLVDTVCLREICVGLGLPRLVSEDGLQTTVKVDALGDNAEFVFLQVGDDVLYVHIKSRVAEKVYAVTPGHTVVRLVPLVMAAWPPTFPVVKS